jgi:hypothetical protein
VRLLEIERITGSDLRENELIRHAHLDELWVQ